MSWFRNVIEKIKQTEEYTDIKSSTFRDYIGGNILTKKILRKQYVLLTLIAFLSFLYVDNIFYCERQLVRAIEMEKKIKDLKYESLTISAELMEINRQSNILKLVKERGLNLQEIETPPIIIEKDSLVQ